MDGSCAVCCENSKITEDIQGRRNVNVDKIDDLIEDLKEEVNDLYCNWEHVKNDMYVRVEKRKRDAQFSTSTITLGL